MTHLRYPRPLKGIRNKCEYIQLEMYPYFLSTFFGFIIDERLLLHIFLLIFGDI